MNIYGFLDDLNFNELHYDGGDILYFRPDDSLISSKFKKFLKTYDFKGSVTVTIILQNPDIEKIYKDLLDYNFNLILKSWDTWFLYESINSLFNLNEIYTPNKIEKCFTSLNHRPRLQRCKFIDEMAKHQLVKNNHVSWHNNSSNYHFKYFDGKKRIIDEIDKRGELPFETFNPPKTAFNNSLWSVVCEYMYEENDNYIRSITEKTYLPIAHKRPFLSLGFKGIYKDLQKLGFVLYDELIDYSFDEIENFDLRLEKFMLEVKNISELNYQRTYDLLKPKIYKNHRNMIKIFKNRIMSINGTKVSDFNLLCMKNLLKRKNVKVNCFQHLV